MRTERERAIILDFETHDGEIEFPNSPYNGPEQGREQAVGLVITRINQSGAVEVLLGKHNSPRNPHKHNRWGWFGETRDEEDDSGTFNTLYRLTVEELERNLADFRFFVGQLSKLNYPATLDEGNRSYIAEMLVVCTDEDLSGHISDFGEIEEVQFEPLNSLFAGRSDKPLREYTIPALIQLFDQGAFESPIMPLRKLVMPKKV